MDGLWISGSPGRYNNVNALIKLLKLNVNVSNIVSDVNHINIPMKPRIAKNIIDGRRVAGSPGCQVSVS